VRWRRDGAEDWGCLYTGGDSPLVPGVMIVMIRPCSRRPSLDWMDG
jgi:hypothetical protein